MAGRRVLIMGAAGRDFHNFNTYYRDNKSYEVVAFTATQIPDIEGRKYPAKLAGKLYPKGIPIESEDNLIKLIEKHDVEDVVFSYSDVTFNYVMDKASWVNAAGANFVLLGNAQTMIDSKVPVIAVTAIRTGCGKSQTTRRVCEILKELGKKVVAIRHPMPYGDLAKQACQRFAKLSDLDKHECTIEEREEYEPHIMRGTIVYAGVDYGQILREAEKEADIIVWDGGNNDTSFYTPDLQITVVDPHRPGHEVSYYPGQTNFVTADVIVINKIDTADPFDVEQVRENIAHYNPEAIVIDGASPVVVEDPTVIRDKRVLVVEDGPTLTHGEMQFGAGVVAARKFGAAELVDPRPYLKGSLVQTFEKYTDIGVLLPAMGYGGKQVKDLEKTINATECDGVVIGTPIDLRRIVKIKHPTTRVTYDLQEIGSPNLPEVLSGFIEVMGKKKRK
ncbi:MAG: cyclic 2,3-diphosphoglycerate synthase [candidate division Zixibacteria bacterium]|nr:cyclic 2,3-diphosphoglycerate synthase [candidate division Zixibacteria bacterium]MBU1469409.1 cyclic 2,3-diphosphoglycerate synthase [candidate division Zixibacteria bacterium]MBU2624163.1 cyclic 2,3-diphosphoglycerate synthase [candidate division Zixibacteria bacterium]